jgi:hypothetical protein
MGRIGVMILGAAASLCSIWPATAQPTAAHPRSNCFRLSQVQSTRSGGEQTIYVRANVNEFYRIDLAHRCVSLADPTSHLVLTPTPGQDVICGPLDLDLKVSDSGRAFRALESCFIKSITRLTPEEAAAIPKRSKP